MYQHDPRHVEVLVEPLELENGSTVQTPIVDDVKDENPVQLDPEQISKTDLTWPCVCSLAKTGHYVRRERAVPENVRFFTAPLHQIEAARSVLEGKERSVPIREHGFRGDSFLRQSGLETNKRGNRQARELLKAYTRKQEIVARSSARAELCAAALGASEAKGVESMMRDFGFAVKQVLVIDPKATEHIPHRHGIGKMKHIDVAHLWLQDEVKSNSMKIRRVKSEDNLADIGTKALSNKILGKHTTSTEVR